MDLDEFNAELDALTADSDEWRRRYNELDRDSMSREELEKFLDEFLAASQERSLKRGNLLRQLREQGDANVRLADLLPDRRAR